MQQSNSRSVCVVRDEKGVMAVVHPPLVNRAMCRDGFAMGPPAVPPIEGFTCGAPEEDVAGMSRRGTLQQCDIPPGTWVADAVEVRQTEGGSRCWAWRDEGKRALEAIDPSLVTYFVVPGMQACEQE